MERILSVGRLFEEYHYDRSSKIGQEFDSVPDRRKLYRVYDLCATLSGFGDIGTTVPSAQH